jgi:hypothetical protein
LALKHPDLMPQSQDLGVTVVTGHDQQSDPCEQQPKQPQDKR